MTHELSGSTERPTGGRSALRLAACALALMALTGTARAEPVTYAQILAAPDDLKLTFTYARERAAAGELQPAAGALERLLLLEPEWDSARLFYAVVLYRLDDVAGALRELKILENRDLSPAQHAEVARYTALISHKSSKTRISGSVSAGVRYDTNPTLASESSTGLAANTVVALTQSRRDDAAFLSQVKLRLEHDLGNANGDFLFLQGSGFLNEQVEVDVQDFLFGEGKTGAVLYREGFLFEPFLRATALVVDDDHRLSEYAGGFDLSRRLGGSVTGRLGFEGIYQDYFRTSLSAIASGRNGPLLAPMAGISVKLNQRNTLSFDAKYLLKDARDDSFSYDGAYGRIGHLMLLGKGQYLLGEAKFWGLWYDRPDPRFSTTTRRKDFRVKGRIAYGLPLGTLGNWLSIDFAKAISSTNFQAAASYYHQDSNIPNFDVDNLSFDAIFTKRFNF